MLSHRTPKLSVLLGLMVFVGCQCGSGPHIVQVSEPYTVVPGDPTVVANIPEVDTAGDAGPQDYEINVPRQCDIYTQNTVRKVDILWVIQNSGSMASHQQQLAENFSSFIDNLLSADPPIDFHIAVTTTDTDDPNQSGSLHGWAIPDTSENAASHAACQNVSSSGVSGSFIACDQNHVCNTAPQGDQDQTEATAKCAFNQMSDVGTLGSSHQRGLYASYLAMTRPENIDDGSGTRFIRPDAALYIVYVASEDDLSCAPVVGNPANSPSSGGTCNTVDPECKCQDDASLTWGTTGFFERFLANYKGYGHSDLVASAAVVATQHNPVSQQYGDPYPGVGCVSQDQASNQPIEAFYGQRYIQVAQATGGTATSICSSDFSNALSHLGFAVSGLRRDFKLSRGPTTQSIKVYVSPYNPTPSDGGAPLYDCTTDADCAGKPGGYDTCRIAGGSTGVCSKLVPTDIAASNDGAQYIQCDNGAVRNVVEFGQDIVPPAEGTVEVCYDIDAHFNTSCQ